MNNYGKGVMEINELKPVIIGTSISGMGISKKLSNAGIHHILIGEPVKERRPILGESVEMFGTSILTDLFPNQQQHYYPKLGINYHLEKSICHFDFKRSFKLPEIVEMMKRTKYNYKAEGSYSLIHVDRALFDAAIYEEVISSPYCHFIHDKVKGVDYDASQDKVIKVHLDKGGSISPSYVYDGSNTLRVLATMLNLGVVYLTDPMRLVFAHFRATAETEKQVNSTETPWYVFTNILRHYQHISGFDGSSWCIPVGKHLSIGTNINHASDFTTEQILEITCEQYRNRNVDIKKVYPELVGITTFSGPLYYCNKVYGKNWILASGAAALTWYTAQTGVESAMFVANIADRLLRFPVEYGQHFENFVDRQVKMHRVHDWLHFHSQGMVTEKDAHGFMINSIRNIQSRFLLGLLTRDHDLVNKLEWLEDIKNYCADLDEDKMQEIVECVKRGETAAEYLTL